MKAKRVKGPASRLSVKADTKLKGASKELLKVPKAIRSREEQIARDMKRKVPAILTNEQMYADTFNVIHARICLNDGPKDGNDSETREKLFEIIGIRGWESTLRILASCARLFAEVPTPVPPLTKFSNAKMHGAAQALDSWAMELRHVDREAAKGHKI